MQAACLTIERVAALLRLCTVGRAGVRAHNCRCDVLTGRRERRQPQAGKPVATVCFELRNILSGSLASMTETHQLPPLEYTMGNGRAAERTVRDSSAECDGLDTSCTAAPRAADASTSRARAQPTRATGHAESSDAI